MNHGNNGMREITVRVVFFGILLSMILSAANAYLGLFAGMTVSAAIPAAVLSLGILSFFKNTIIQENNLVGTCASAGESLAAGVIFTLPALLMLGFWEEFDYIWVAVIAGIGGILGVLFTIPLRRSLVVESDLKFPEGIATAKVLETGRKDPSGIKYLAKAALAGGLFKAGAKGVFGLWPEILEGAKQMGGSVAYFGSNLSPALLSVGYIVGINISVLIFLGGAANWLVTIPICASMSEWAIYPESHELAGQAMSAVDFAGEIWSTKTRYIGVGGMLVGGLWTVFHLRKSLLSGITSGLKAYKTMPHEAKVVERTDKDIPMKWVLICIIASVVPMFLVYLHFVGDVQISLVMSVIMVLAGFLFAAVAGYMAGLVGSSNNPISGVTIATVLVSAILLFLLMKGGPEEFLKKGPAFAVIIGSVVCCAAAISGDVMQDLKCGRLVGTTPWKQQVMELIGVVAAALVIPAVLMLLHEAYGFKGMEGASESALSAPQAGLMSSVARGVFGGDLPKVFIYIGMGIAVAIIALDTYLQKINCPFRTPVLAVAIGFYLPFELSVPIFAGGLITVAVKAYQKRKRFNEHEVEASDRKGLLFASGLITGEALIGILMAIPIIICKRFDIETPMLGLWDAVWGKWLGLILIVGAALWLYATASKPDGIKSEVAD